MASLRLWVNYCVYDFTEFVIDSINQAGNIYYNFKTTFKIGQPDFPKHVVNGW